MTPTLSDSAHAAMWKAYHYWDETFNDYDSPDDRSEAGQAAWNQWILENAGITIVDPNSWGGWKITDQKLYLMFMLRWS